LKKKVDFPREGVVPWGINGLGVFIISLLSIHFEVFFVCLFATGFSLKKPRSKF